MKQLGILLLALVLCLGLAGCGDEDALALYSQMSEKMAGVESLEMSIKADIGVAVAGEQVSMTMNARMQEVMLSDTDAQVAMEMSMNMGAGGAIDSKIYYKDGYMYTDIMGMKSKAAAGLDEILEQAYANNLPLTKDAVTDTQVVSTDSGKELRFTVSGDLVNEVMGGTVNGMLENLGMAGAGVSFGDMDYTLSVDGEGMLEGYHMVYGASMEIMGMTMEMTYDVSCTVDSVNTITAIDFPADLDSYVGE